MFIISLKFFNFFLRYARVAIVSLLLGFFVVMNGYGQSATTDSINTVWFDEMIGVVNTGIINGPEYKIETFSASSNPFLSSQPSLGYVKYDQQLYYVPLLFDIYKNEVVVKYLTSTGVAWFIQLDKNLVDEFQLEGRQFRKHDGRFYEVIFDREELAIVIDRSKVGQVRDQLFHYVPVDQYFVIHAHHRQPMRSAGVFSRLLASKTDKRDFRQFLKDKRIKIRKFRREELVEVASFVYDRLK